MKKTKALAWLMTLVMVIGLLPATVLADDVPDKGNEPAVKELQQEADLNKVNLLSEDIEEDIEDDDYITDVDLEEDQYLAPLAEEEELAVEAFYVSADGSDENSGTKDKPWATLAKAVLKAEDGATIYIMSDLTMTKCARYYNKNLTITSLGDEAYTVTRDEKFDTQNDPARSWYNPAMIEVGGEVGQMNASLRLENIILDDANLKMGAIFAQAPIEGVSGEEIVQDAMIATYNSTAKITLGKGAVLQNFGGMSAVRISGSDLVMEDGSVIKDTMSITRDKGKGAGTLGPAGAIWMQGGSIVMKEGSLIDNINGRAIYADSGAVEVNGTISNITSNKQMWQGLNGAGIHARNNADIVLNGTIKDISGISTSVVYVLGSEFVMNNGSLIQPNNTNVKGIALYGNTYGKVYMDGEITGIVLDNAININVDMSKRPISTPVEGILECVIGPNGNIHDNNVSNGAIYMQTVGGTLDIYGKINNNTNTKNSAGAIYMAHNHHLSTATMHAGAEICNNTATKYGAICVSACTFTMKGGKISDNVSTGDYGGIFVRNGGRFIMEGGMIANNSAKGIGGGISFEASDKTFLNEDTGKTEFLCTDIVELKNGTVCDNSMKATEEGSISNDITVCKANFSKIDRYLKITDKATIGNPAVYFVTDAKTVISEDLDVKLGNASTSAITAMDEAVKANGWADLLATYWMQHDGAETMTVGGVTPNKGLPVYAVVLETGEDGNPDSSAECKYYRAEVGEDGISFTVPQGYGKGCAVALVQPTKDYGTLTIEVNPTVLYEDKDAETYTLKYTTTFEISDNLASLIDQGALTVKDLQFVPDLDEKLTQGTVSELVYNENAKTLTWTFDATMAAEDFEEDDSILTSGAVMATTEDLTILVPGNVAETTLESAKYEKKVTFKVKNGTWSDGTTENQVIYVELDADRTAPMPKDKVPTGMIANKGYKSVGAWDKALPDELSGTEAVEYTFTFEKANSGGGNSKPSKKPIVAGDVEEILNTEDHFQYVQGYPDGTVGPERNITRAEVTVIFFRLLQDHVREELMTAENNFPDVNLADWFNVGISTMESGNFVSGYDDGTFKPNAYITRAELATIISNFDDLEPAKENKFADCEGHWAEKYINSAAEKGWLSGYEDGLYRPNQYITRAETMSMINRVLNRRVDADGLHKDAKQWRDNPESKWYYYAVLEATNHHDYQRADVKDMENWTAINPNKIWEN